MTSAPATPRPSIIVLLPVYDGERFLGEQLDSILAQEAVDVRIICRDDCSRDTSAAILDRYAEAHPERLEHVPGDRNLGASASFAWLMQNVLDRRLLEGPTPPYIAFADQDDRWQPQRLSRCLAAMHELEREVGGNRPLLVHSDLRVVDDRGEEIAPSMAAYQGLQPRRQRLAGQVLSNSVTGCTAMINKAMLERALPIPESAIMHDWWLSLVASAFGGRRYLEQPLVDYRQHGSNAIGAVARQKPRRGQRLLKRLLHRQQRELFFRTAAQARAFHSRYGPNLSSYHRMVLRLAALLEVDHPIVQKTAFRVLRRL